MEEAINKYRGCIKFIEKSYGGGHNNMPEKIINFESNVATSLQ